LLSSILYNPQRSHGGKSITGIAIDPSADISALFSRPAKHDARSAEIEREHQSAAAEEDLDRGGQRPQYEAL
jgi:hypothetical protein